MACFERNGCDQPAFVGFGELIRPDQQIQGTGRAFVGQLPAASETRGNVLGRSTIDTHIQRTRARHHES